MCQKLDAAARLPRVRAIRLPRLFGRRRGQAFEDSFEIGIIEPGEIAAFERIDPSFDLRAEALSSRLSRTGTCSAPAARDLRRQFVTWKRGIAFACPLEHLKRLLEIAASGAFGEILLGAQRRYLLIIRGIDVGADPQLLGAQRRQGI